MIHPETIWLAIVGYVALLAVLLGSWIANIVKLTDLIGTEISSEFVLRVVGVPIAPLGIIMGWL